MYLFNSQKFSPTTTCVILFLVGIGFLGYEALAWYNSQSAANWQETTGYIVRSDIEIQRSRRSSHAVAKVFYQYSANGKQMTGTNVSFGSVSILSFQDAKMVVQKYPAGSEVAVYFNPEVPSEAILERELPNSAYVGVILGTCFLLAGPVVLVVTAENGPLMKMIMNQEAHGYSAQATEDAVAAWKQDSGLGAS